VEQNLVIQEVTAVGFELSRRGGFLQNSEDTRDWNASPGAAAERRGTSDRFALAFVRPRE
jgi:predicted methyltransferase